LRVAQGRRAKRPRRHDFDIGSINPCTLIKGSFEIREGIFDDWVIDIKLAASNVTTQTQLQTVTGLGIEYCTDGIFALAMPPK
jgi:hypothetical protein